MPTSVGVSYLTSAARVSVLPIRWAGGIRRSVLGDRWPAADRDAATDDRHARALTGIRQHGRQPPKLAVQAADRTIRHRHGEPRRATAGAMRTGDHDDRAAGHALLQ